MAGDLSNEETSWLIASYEKRTTASMPAHVLARLLRLGLLEQKVGGPGMSVAGEKWLAEKRHPRARQPL